MATGSASRMVTDKHIASLAEGLAHQAGISVDAAHKVLKVLHIDKLDENMHAFTEIMSDPKKVNALGLGRDHAQAALRVASPSALTVENLRLAVKPTGLQGIMV